LLQVKWQAAFKLCVKGGKKLCLIPEGLKDEGTERIHSWVMLPFSWQLPTHGNGSCCQFQSNRRQEVRIFSASISALLFFLWHATSGRKHFSDDCGSLVRLQYKSIYG